jgi:hypothetical protein
VHAFYISVGDLCTRLAEEALEPPRQFRLRFVDAAASLHYRSPNELPCLFKAATCSTRLIWVVVLGCAPNFSTGATAVSVTGTCTEAEASPEILSAMLHSSGWFAWKERQHPPVCTKKTWIQALGSSGLRWQLRQTARQFQHSVPAVTVPISPCQGVHCSARSTVVACVHQLLGNALATAEIVCQRVLPRAHAVRGDPP